MFPASSCAALLSLMPRSSRRCTRTSAYLLQLYLTRWDNSNAFSSTEHMQRMSGVVSPSDRGCEVGVVWNVKGVVRPLERFMIACNYVKCGVESLHQQLTQCAVQRDIILL